MREDQRLKVKKLLKKRKKKVGKEVVLLNRTIRLAVLTVQAARLTVQSNTFSSVQFLMYKKGFTAVFNHIEYFFEAIAWSIIGIRYVF